MHAYGIRGNILRWFRSYLTNISQFVSYDGRQSEIQSITCGVPQGSILGPLLFIIYMNDICNVSELLFTVLYADDTCVVIHGNTNYPIIMNNSSLSNLKNHKYLGVILDSKMSWIQHIAYVKNKLAKGIGIMFKARTYPDKRSLINPYNTYIYLYLIYCIESWGNAPK